MEQDISRIIEMAWEDRTPFEAIKKNYGLNQNQVEKLMRENFPKLAGKIFRPKKFQ